MSIGLLASYTISFPEPVRFRSAVKERAYSNQKDRGPWERDCNLCRFLLACACVMLFLLIHGWVNYSFLLKDIDECETGANECDENANCFNTDGSYTCRCQTGFAGDGNLCQGAT